jgi:hypothetical protein
MINALLFWERHLGFERKFYAKTQVVQKTWKEAAACAGKLTLDVFVTMLYLVCSARAN